MPYGLAFDTNTRTIFIADCFAHRVLGLKRVGDGYLLASIYGRYGYGTGFNTLSWPVGIAFDPKRRWIYVTEGEPNHRVQVFSEEGVSLGFFGGSDSFFVPAGIALGPSRNIFICDRRAHRLQTWRLRLRVEKLQALCWKAILKHNLLQNHSQ